MRRFPNRHGHLARNSLINQFGLGAQRTATASRRPRHSPVRAGLLQEVFVGALIFINDLRVPPVSAASAWSKLPREQRQASLLIAAECPELAKTMLIATLNDI